MKRFYESGAERGSTGTALVDAVAARTTSLTAPLTPLGVVSVEDAGLPAQAETHCARVAVYDRSVSAPRIVDVTATDCSEFIEILSQRIYSLAREAGGSIPYSVIRELAENLLHADFREPVVSVLDSGRSIRFSDQGPGIADKERALLPGFTTASAQAKRFIRGVGSGLPIVKDYLYLSGGSLEIEDNLGGGAVVTIRSGSAARMAGSPTSTEIAYTVGAMRVAGPSEQVYRDASPEGPSHPDPVAVTEEVGAPASLAVPLKLSLRQKQVLAVVADAGNAGPSLVARELSVGVSTAYRDLALLEQRGLLAQVDSGKRVVTDDGLAALKGFMHG